MWKFILKDIWNGRFNLAWNTYKAYRRGESRIPEALNGRIFVKEPVVTMTVRKFTKETGEWETIEENKRIN